VLQADADQSIQRLLRAQLLDDCFTAALYKFREQPARIAGELEAIAFVKSDGGHQILQHHVRAARHLKRVLMLVREHFVQQRMELSSVFERQASEKGHDPR
jgi:hypothetical protein